MRFMATVLFLFFSVSIITLPERVHAEAEEWASLSLDFPVFAAGAEDVHGVGLSILYFPHEKPIGYVFGFSTLSANFHTIDSSHKREEVSANMIEAGVAFAFAGHNAASLPLVAKVEAVLGSSTFNKTGESVGMSGMKFGVEWNYFVLNLSFLKFGFNERESVANEEEGHEIADFVTFFSVGGRIPF